MSRRLVRPLTALVTLYLLLDFSAPSIPGAFTFEAATSMEAVRGARDADDHRSLEIPLPESALVKHIALVVTEGSPRRAGHVSAIVPARRCSLARAALAQPLSEVG